MEIHQLRALEAIAAEGSFQAAAKHLDLSQSSLSHAIAALETELGTRLFDRGRYGAKPTDAGRRILPHARQVLTALNAIRSESVSSTGPLSGRVRVGSIPSAAVAFLPRVIARFTRAHPHIEVVLLEEPSQTTQSLEEWLRTQTIDIALVQLPAPGMKTTTLSRDLIIKDPIINALTFKNLIIKNLIKDELCAILPSASPLASRRQLSIRDLATQPFIMSRYTSEPLLRAAFLRHRLSPRIRFEVQDLGTLVSMVREGLGFSIVPRLAFPAPLPGVTLVPVTPRIHRQLGLAIRDQEYVSPVLHAFMRSIEETATKKRRR